MKIFNKPVGETPLGLIKRKKLEGAAYAGRLDPMAEGLMIVLDKDIEKKNRKVFENLDKVYRFDVLYGIETDTYDILGIPKIRKTKEKHEITSGEFIQPYPPYSYFRVNGKPLFYWARKGEIAKIKIPEKKVTIKKIEKLKKFSMNNNELLDYVKTRIIKVSGNFRQEKILNEWEKLLSKEQSFDCETYIALVSSGTYIRSIANQSGGVAIKIIREKVGEFSLEDVID